MVRVKIVSFRSLAKSGQYGFNLVIQFADDQQLLVAGMRVINAKIHPPALKLGSSWVRTNFFDGNTALMIYDALKGLETPPVLDEADKAIKPLLATPHVVKFFTAEF